MREKLGANFHLLNDPRLWAIAATLNLRYARLDLNWDSVHPSPDRREWEVLDRAVDGALTHRFEIYGSIGYTPSWANNGAGRGRPPTSIVDWQNHVEEIGQRYKDKIQLWGVWNEFSGTVKEYVEYLFIPAYQTLKMINQNNRVCGVDLSTEGDWPRWLADFLGRTTNLTDVLTVHSYQPSGRAVLDVLNKPRPRWIPRWFPWPQPSVRQVMGWAGASELPLALTEFGWDSERIGEDQQAKQLEEFLEALQHAPELSAALYFQFVDEPGVGCGLLRQDFSEKPAAGVLRHYASQGVV